MNLRTTRNVLLIIAVVTVTISLFGSAIFPIQYETEKKVTYLPLRILSQQVETQVLPAPQLAGCLAKNLNELSATPAIPIRTPHVLPTNYELQAVEHLPRSHVALYYWDKPLCPFEYSYLDYSLKGVIVVFIYYPSIPQIADSQYVQSVIEEGKGSNASWRAITLNGTMSGNPAAGTEPFMSKSIFYENEVIMKEEQIPAPAKIYFIHQIDGIEYRINANMPLEDLVKVAESFS